MFYGVLCTKPFLASEQLQDSRDSLRLGPSQEIVNTVNKKVIFEYMLICVN